MIHDNNDSFSNSNGWEDHGEPNPEFGPSSEFEEYERRSRIEEMREAIEQAGGDWRSAADWQNLPSEVEEALLRRVLYLETAPRTTYAKLLISDKIELTYPGLLDTEEQVHEKLWEVIHGLADRRVFLYYTNHLSNRELYSELWYDFLNHDTVDISWDPDAACHIDLLGSGSEADTETWLTYYADEAERDWWGDTLTGAGKSLPEPQTAPFDRDRILPKREHY